VITGLTGGEQVKVVLPLGSPIPDHPQYRKLKVSTGQWINFDISNGDSALSAPQLSDGGCPSPGSADYQSIRESDECVQLTITNNGPNDDDTNLTTITDPGGVAEGFTLMSSDSENGLPGGGGDWWLPVIGLIGLAARRLRK